VTTAAALVIADAPSAPDALAGLAPLLDAGRRAALQALLVRRAAAWAAAAAPGGAAVAVAPGRGVAEVAALLPAGVDAFAQEGEDPSAVLGAAVARAGRGPILIALPGCARLGPAHAAAALDDLASGCDVVFGSTLEGGWYLAGLREPRPELLTVAPDAWQRAGGIGLVLERARAAGASVGMIRHERLLATPGDVASLLADPLLDPELRAALSGG
jgi:glycosyltransferase A (GT-A) superfamily protein (DUF2064 family)